MTDLNEFQQEVRTWLEVNCPASMRTPMVADEVTIGGRDTTFKNPDTKLWLERMGNKGWTAPTWPKKYGGGGLSPQETNILKQELKRIKARVPMISFGLWMIGPVLLEYGTEEQKQEHLPKIVRGEISWCQGYSEPGYGSDLAGLQTRAVEDGEDYIINGQKVWTSYADKCDWIYALVRTNTEVKHGGITMILFDMASTGVSTRPIKLISGLSSFCETFFDDVRVPKKNVVGEVNDGWAVSNRLLQFERENISADVFASDEVFDVRKIAKDYCSGSDGKVSDPLVRDSLSKILMKDHALKLTFKRVMEGTKAGSSTGSTSSIFKFIGAELNKDRYEFAIDAMGQQGMGWEGKAFTPYQLDVAHEWLRSKANSIEGGTTEINLNVIAKRVLGLRDS